MTEILEIMMLLCFGASWPLNVLKSYRARTAKGKSLAFLILICAGYVCGIIAKPLSGSFKWYVLLFYILNLVLVLLDVLLYFRNRKLDKRADEEFLGLYVEHQEAKDSENQKEKKV